MSSRLDIKHYTQTTQPTIDIQVGDEWFNPGTNRFYKFLVVNGTAPTWTEILNTASSTAYSGPSQELWYVLQNGYTGFNNTGVQGMFNNTGTGSPLGLGVYLTANTIYNFEINITLIKTAGTTSHTISTAFGGTANLNFIYYQVIQDDAGGGMNTRFSTSIGFTSVNTAASTAVTGALTAAAQYFTILVKGIRSEEHTSELQSH